MSDFWQLDQLKVLSTTKPGTIQKALDALWIAMPSLQKEVILTALAEGRINATYAARELNLSEDVVIEQAAEFGSEGTGRPILSLIECEAGKAAKLPESGLAVWEVIRKFRQLGTIQAVLESFPSLSEAEMQSALGYATMNSEEIDKNIRDYDDLQSRKYTEYPSLV
jgi:uncharacterized protein (DUF433 family)